MLLPAYSMFSRVGFTVYLGLLLKCFYIQYSSFAQYHYTALKHTCALKLRLSGMSTVALVPYVSVLGLAAELRTGSGRMFRE